MFELIKETLFCLIITVTGIVIFIVRHTYIHEMGHLLVLRHYNRESIVGIVLNKRFLIIRKYGIQTRSLMQKKFRYKLYLDKYIKGESEGLGKTYTKNNYMEFIVDELKSISKAGLIAQTVYGIILSIALSAMSYIILDRKILALFTFIYLIFTTFLIGALSILQKTEEGKWPDKKIWRSPERFYEHIRSNDDGPGYEDFFGV